MLREKRCAIVRILMILLALIIIVFAVVNCIWYFGYRQRYSAVEKHLEAEYLLGEESNDALRYTKEVGEYTILMKPPAYLGSGGFISVSKASSREVSLDDEGNILGSGGMDITLFIWPKYFSGCEIGLFFQDEASSVWYQVYVTADLELKNTDGLENDDAENILRLISENRDEINEMLRIAEENTDIDLTQS
jgi:hypothetical protein